MGKRKLAYTQKRKASRGLAFALSLAMTGSLVPAGIVPVKENVKAATAEIADDFESGSYQGGPMGSPTLTIANETENVHGGKAALLVSNRTADWNAYSYDVKSMAGKTVKLDAFMKVASDSLTAAAVVKHTVDGEDKYDWFASTATKNGEWVELKKEFEMPEGAQTLYFITHDSEASQGTTDDYYLDDISLQEVGEVSEQKAIEENFDTYASADEKMGNVFGSPKLSLSETGVGGTKALQVSERTANYFGYAYNLGKYRGNTIKLSVKMAAYEADDETVNNLAATIKTTKSGEDDNYQCVASAEATGKDFVTLTGTYEIPKDCDTAEIYFEAPENVSYLLDDVSISVEGEYADPTEKPAYVDVTGYEILKDLYKDYFKLGVASEALSHWGGYNPLNEIGNPAKEALIKQEFNSLTFGNELKPDCNMGYNDESATETDLPFVIDSSAKEMLDWAKANDIPVRGHVLVWHSQCPDAVFCKGYEPVYKDEGEKVLDPSCYVDKATMLKRLESYIYHAMEYMYANGYGKTIYAWDVVNEAVEPGTNQYNLRNSYWYQIMGTDFMYYSFKYAREASEKYAKQYAALYDVDPADDAAVKAIEPKLFYNDYNEYQKEKCDAIIDILTKDYNGHNIKGEGLIDGVGMQSHVADTTKLDTYIEALRRYDEAIGEVHITELDVAQTSTGVNAEYYQAVFYNELFKALVEEVKNGVNLTSVTIWGLTDDNSWKKESSPLLFNADLSKKMAFDGIVNAITGKEMPEPAYVAPDFTDMNMDFEDGTTQGFGTRGDGSVTVQSDVVLDGKSALLDSGRTATWNGTNFDVSRFIGQTIAISAWVKSDADEVKLSADIDGKWPNIATVSTKNGDWVQLIGTYKVPADMTSLKLYFEASDLSDIYIDHVKVKLVGLEEGFEEDVNIAKARGVGHMPVVAVTDKESHNAGGHSLSVKREAKEASMSFDVSKYIGQTVKVKAFVKTDDSKVKLGLDGDSPVQIAETSAVKGGWTEITGTYAIPKTLASANMYIETDGNADFYVDDISVVMDDYVDDVEGDLNFATRWGGAGEIAKVEDGAGNHAAVLTERSESYYGTVFDVSAYLGMEVEISLDVKTDDSTINLTGDIDNVWPNYASVPSDPGKYKTVRAIVNLPKDVASLRLYVETDGNSDLYVDNLRIRRVPVGKEYKVTFDGTGVGKGNTTQIVTENSFLTAPEVEETEGNKFAGWFKDAKGTRKWNFETDKVTADTILYAKWEKDVAATEPSEEPSKETVHKIVLNIFKGDSIIAKALELQKYLASGEDVEFVIEDKDGNAVCVWTFSAENYSSSIVWKDIKLEVVVKPGKDVGFSKGIFVDMKHQGKLPMEAKVKVKADSKFKTGTKLYLYRVDTKTKKLYRMPNSNYKVGKDGCVDLALTMGADFVLLPTKADTAKTVGVLDQVKPAKNATVKKGSQKSVKAVLPDTLLKLDSLKNFNKAEHRAVYGATVSYKSSNPSVASVSKDGKMTAKGKGKTVITTTVKLSNGSVRNYKTIITVK